MFSLTSNYIFDAFIVVKWADLRFVLQKFIAVKFYKMIVASLQQGALHKLGWLSKSEFIINLSRFRIVQSLKISYIVPAFD